MKKTIAFIITLFITTTGFAQTQQGYVKTLGRPEKPGEALEGVTLRVKGSHNTVVSDPNGKFSLLLTDLKNGDAYSLQRVQKNGYELNEIDFIGRKLAFSDKVPLTIVMVSSEQLQADKQRIENTAFATAQKNYTAKMSLIEKQLKDNEITNEQYQAAINDLQDKFEKYQSLIDGLATHYAHTDYDELNEKDREINLCIENGDLERADSLIRTLFDPIDVLQRNVDALADIEQQIGQARGIITQANADMEAVLKQQEKDAEYLYQLYTIAAARFDNEKALQYIETRAELDTVKWMWQLDAGEFCKLQNQFNKAEFYFTRTYDILTELTDNFFDSDIESANQEALLDGIKWMNYHNYVQLQLAHIHAQTQRVEESLGALQETSEFYQDFIDAMPDAPDDLKADYDFLNAVAKSAQAMSHMRMGQYAESEALQLEALEIYRHVAASQPENLTAKAGIAENLTNLGLLYRKWKKYDQSMACLQEGIAIWRYLVQIDQKKYESGLAPALDNLGSLYQEIKDYKLSEAFTLEALEIYRQLAKSNQNEYEPRLSIVLYNLAYLYAEINRFSESEKLYMESLEIRRRWAKKQPYAYEQNLAETLVSLGSLYYNAKDYAKCEPMYQEGYQIIQRLAQKEPLVYNSKLAITKTNLAYLYYNTGKIPESVTLCVEAYELFQQLAQEGPLPYKDELELIKGNFKELAPWLESEATDFRDNGQYEESETYYQKALDIYRLLAKENPTQYDPEIAGTLNSLGILYANGKQYNKCEVAFNESVEIYQRLAKTDPQTYQSEAFRMRNNLAALEVNKAQDYNGKKQYEEAAAAYVKVIEIRKTLAKEDHVSNYNYDSEVASALNSLAIVYVNLNRYQESEAAFKESLEIYQRLSQTDAAKYESLVTQALNNLSILASQLRKKANQEKEEQRYEESEALLSQALSIYKDLAQTNPTKYDSEITATLAEIEQIRILLKKQ